MVLTAALCITGMAIWHDLAEKAEQARRDQTIEAQLLPNLHNIGAKLDFGVADGATN